jgi:DNA-binding NarL/FixJ family response regulator
MKAAHRREQASKVTEVPSAQLEQLLQLQRDVLEMIAIGCTGKEILDQLCRPAINQLRITQPCSHR